MKLLVFSTPEVARAVVHNPRIEYPVHVGEDIHGLHFDAFVDCTHLDHKDDQDWWDTVWQLMR